MAATAYAALLSLTHIIEQITNHDQPPVQIDEKLLEPLAKNVNFLQHFLEDYSHRAFKEAERLEFQITDAAHAAEDIIETHIVDQILTGSTDLNLLCQGIQKVIQDMSLVKKESMEMKEKMNIEIPRISIPVSSSKPLPAPHNMNNTVVGFDDAVIEIMDRLTGYQISRQILPIVGMGGIGKSTLAKSVYENPLIVQHFHISAWVTISQEYTVREIILRALSDQENSINNQESEDKLGEQLYKKLCGRKYLIVLDDMWSIEAWDKVKFYFPDNNNGSRILVTTRLRNVAIHFSDDIYEMNFLDEEKSWNLLRKEAFAQEGCPLELEEMGRKIVKKCKGLPLSVVVVGGLLAKSAKTREYWEYVLENLSTIVNLNDNEHCLKILSLSYHHLPIHLKPCFLYMGVFREDEEIRVSWLKKLWVSEGFLKPISSKLLEVVAEEYLRDLIDRNLILVDELGTCGTVKYCKIHDLLRDLCVREARKDRFLCATRVPTVENLEASRRICIHQSMSNEEYSIDQVHQALQSSPLARSLICNLAVILPSLPFRLLRVLQMLDNYKIDKEYRYSFENIFQFVNSRYLAFRGPVDTNLVFPSSIRLLWNLQTLIIKDVWFEQIILPSEIWEMRQLRHLVANGIILMDPPSIDSKDYVLTHLQTLKVIKDFMWSEEVVKRIPNIKKIGICYFDGISDNHYSLNNLNLFHKLESLSLYVSSVDMDNLLHNLAFPCSLKKLKLYQCRLLWKNMTVIGSLPHLQVLKLRQNAFVGPEWIPSEGEFLTLKHLEICDCHDLEYWVADSTHFPCLEKLMLRFVRSLKEIPLDFGEIPTLRSIELIGCSDAVMVSAKKIVEEQENAGNEGWIQVHVSS